MTQLKEQVRKACSQHPNVNSQRDLAEYLGIQESQMSRILSNRRRRLTGAQCAQLAEFLNMSLDDFNSLLISDETAARDEKSTEAMMAEIEQLSDDQGKTSRQLTEILTRLDELQNVIDVMKETDHGVQA
tara:strand:+ start:100 stop:489 length:390 start_codon:yes stop_codon:yes gene_type:complete